MKYLLKAGTIYRGDASAPETADLLTEGPIIKKIAPQIEDAEARVICAEGMHIFPGFIDPMNSTGAQDLTFPQNDKDEISNPVTPEADIAYSVDFQEMEMERLYETGITATGCAPGNRNVIGGLMAVTRTHGKNSADLMVLKKAAMKGSVATAVKETYADRNKVLTHMGIFAELDKQLRDPHPNMKPVLEGRIPFVVWAETVQEINALLDITKPYENLKLIIVGAFDAPLCAEALCERGVGLIFGDLIDFSKNVYYEHDLTALKRIPLSFCLTGQYGPSGKVRYLWTAAEFLKAGFTKAEVLEMMTAVPAKMLGVEDRLGRLEEGYEADLSIWTEDPLETYGAICKMTMVNGIPAFEKEI